MSSHKILARAFYNRPASVVARELVGKWLVRVTPEGECGGIIVETEAYLADDPASHAFRGRTRRNASMFGPPGHAYVYFIYGNHFCFNAVCGPEGIAEAVLIRAIEPAFGLEAMQARRGVAEPKQVSNGPGKLCAALGIGRDLDGADLCGRDARVCLAENPAAELFLKTHGPVKASGRIGISRGAESPLRFYLARNPFVSRLERKAKQ